MRITYHFAEKAQARWQRIWKQMENLPQTHCKLPIPVSRQKRPFPVPRCGKAPLPARRGLDRGRLRRFRHIALQLAALAKGAGIDLLIEDDMQACTGHIVLAGDGCLILAAGDSSACKNVSKLMAMASTVLVDPRQGRCRLAVWVDLRAQR